ncbi:MAG: aldo/keto reductase [Treponema sp.]|nr:aldo/keto reductase [Treponema sp.]
MITKDFKDLKISTLGMGNMRFPTLEGIQSPMINYDKAQEIIDYALANGINYFDTAYVYHKGESEKFLGFALQKHKRESFYLTTKYLLSASEDYKAVFEEQLSRLKTDYIDTYMIHAITDDSCQKYIDCGCIEYFIEQQKKGRVRYLGFSNHSSPNTLAIFADHYKWDIAQIQLNYYDWIFGTAKEEYEVLNKRGIPIVVMEPVRGGRLAKLSSKAEAMLKEARPEWSIASWAFRWIKRLDLLCVLSGMALMEQIEENVKLFSDTDHLNDEEEELLFKACREYQKEVSVPCTDCGYCIDDCPAKINIPKILEVYNKYRTDGIWGLNDLKDVKTEGKIPDCTGCGVCNDRCTQKIDVRAVMIELSEVLRKRGSTPQ